MADRDLLIESSILAKLCNYPIQTTRTELNQPRTLQTYSCIPWMRSPFITTPYLLGAGCSSLLMILSLILDS